MNIIDLLFGCRHKKFSFPQRSKVDGRDYVTCLGCGKSHEYEIGVGLVDSNSTMEEHLENTEATAS